MAQNSRHDNRIVSQPVKDAPPAGQPGVPYAGLRVGILTKEILSFDAISSRKISALESLQE
jgi:hypothetical protein